MVDGELFGFRTKPKLILGPAMGEDKHGQCIGTDKVKLVLPVVQDDFMCGDLSFF